MNLLGAKLYDPTSAATFGSAASAMAVFDTTNLRIAFVVPPSGFVRVVIEVTVHGATTYSQILLGVMNGAAITAKVCPDVAQNGTAAATTMLRARADFVVPGLSPGASLTWDAAWGIETFVASSLIKYGGPANATANNDFGAAQFEIWDPAPIFTPTSATAPTTTVQDKLVTEKTAVDAIKTKTDFLPSATAGAAGGVFIAGTNAATTITTSLTTTFTGNLTGSVGSVTGAVGSVTGAVGSVTGSVASVTARVTANTDQLSGQTVTAAAGVTFPTSVASPTNITAGTITTATNLTNAPTAGDFTAVMKTSIGTAVAASAVASVTGNVGGNVTGSVGSVTGLTASDVGAIKTQTDKLTFTVANKLDVNILYVNGVQILGNGAGTTWGPV